MPHTFVPPPPAMSFKLPPRLRVSIGDAIAVCSAIESCIIETLWLNEDADLERKKKISKVFAKANAARFQALVESIPGAKSELIWPALEKLREDRNLIGHGVWMVDDKHVPWVSWHSKFLESDDYTVSEQFPYERFEQYQRIANHLLETFARFKALMEEALEKKRVAEKDAQEKQKSPGT